MAASKDIDWTLLMIEYVTTNTSYRKLSEKYDVSINTIYEVSKENAWREKRKKYLEKVFKKTVEKASVKDAKRLAKLINATTRTIDVATRALDDDKQFYRYITDVGEAEYEKLDTRSLRDFTAVLKDLTGLMRDFYNIPTPSQAEAQRIASERLIMDQKRAESAESDDGDTGVILLPSVLSNISEDEDDE